VARASWPCLLLLFFCFFFFLFFFFFFYCCYPRFSGFMQQQRKHTGETPVVHMGGTPMLH